MLRLPYISILILLLIGSCKPAPKTCRVTTDDIYLAAYNDILNEILNTQIFKREIRDIIETDTSLRGILYLDTKLKPAFESWTYIEQDTNKYSLRIRNIMKKVSDNGQEIIDSINQIQTKYTPGDFHICIARLASRRDSTVDPSKYIGKIVFSKIILNKTKDKGLLYFEFTCGEMCGWGKLLLIEKRGQSWRIKESLRTWIS